VNGIHGDLGACPQVYILAALRYTFTVLMKQLYTVLISNRSIRVADHSI